MKKLVILLTIAGFCVVNSNAQNISFSGTGLTTIIVENATQYLFDTLNAEDVLVLTPSSGIHDEDNSDFSGIQIYPNPVTSKSTLEIQSPVSGDAVISVYDLTGRLIINTVEFLGNSPEFFSLSGFEDGFYLINVQGQRYNLSGRFLCSGTAGETPVISKNEGYAKASTVKSVKTEVKGVETDHDMSFSTGDILKFTGISGNNRTVITDSPTISKTVNFTFYNCADADSNHYAVVKIGSQLWMAENLKTTRYLNGDTITYGGEDGTAYLDLRSGAYSWPNGDTVNKDVYGALYNWWALTDSRGICPQGWHVSTDADWSQMVGYLGGQIGAFYKLQETGLDHWHAPNNGTNSTGFTAKPNGLRGSGYSYTGPNGRSYTWTTAEYESDTSAAWMWGCGYNWGEAAGYLNHGHVTKTYGFGVRCVEGVTPPIVSTTSVTVITTDSSVIGGNVSSTGSSPVIERGVYWGDMSDVEISGTKVPIGSGAGSFSLSISGLTDNKTYFVKAYATSSVGTAYGDLVTFTTLPETPSDITGSIARLKDNKQAVLSLFFDDSTPGQATMGVPALNSRNLVGTWFVNPGREYYNNYASVWQHTAPEGGQELANHTYTHSGASTYEQTEYEVGEAAKAIWDIWGVEDFGALMGFETGGGTTWNEEILNQVLDKYKCIKRLSNAGEPITARSLLPGSTADEMFDLVPSVISSGTWGRLHFHGISADSSDYPLDYGNGAVYIGEFERFLDRLLTVTDQLWVGGFIQVYKYKRERITGAIQIGQTGQDSCSINLSTPLDPKYYNEPLTLIINNIPGDWTNCHVVQGDMDETIPVSGGKVMFDALPNKGNIIFTKAAK